MKKAILLGTGAAVVILAAAIGVFVAFGPDIDGSPEEAGGEGSNSGAVAIAPVAAPGDSDSQLPGPGTQASSGTGSSETGLVGEQDVPRAWARDFPQTDFAKTSINYSEILSGGPPRDGIAAIDEPSFGTVADAAAALAPTVPMVTIAHNGEAKAYPLSTLMFHEIVNDEIGGMPIAVTFCPLCNSTVVFKAEIDGQRLDFGTTGRLRNSDLVMYDRQTESWW
jgi:hypothetical protein